MAITLNRWEAEIVVPTGDWTLTLNEAAGGGDTTATVSAGTYTWATMVTAIKAALEAASSNALTYTVSISDGQSGTGLLSITAGAGEFTLTAIAVGLFALCGFASPLASSSSTAIGTKHVKGLWLPDRAHLCTYQFGDEKDVSDRSTLMTPDGINASYLAYNRVRILPDLRYQNIDRQKARIAGEVYDNESWGTFWRDVIDGDQGYFRIGKVRIFPDRDSDGTFYDYWYGPGAREDNPTNVREGWQKLWNITHPILQRVET